MSEQSVLIISLDFELYWGIFDKVLLEDRINYFKNTREVIPEMLSLFAKNQIHVTWATVGMLFATDWEDWGNYIPKELPSYLNQNLSAYHLKDKYCGTTIYNPFFFAPELVRLIQKTPYQEIGTHTFSHYYCQVEGQSVDQFRSDLQATKRIAEREDIALRSLVFPRNQYNELYLKVCFEEGIRTVRSNPVDWFWKKAVEDKITKKVFRTGDGYIPLGRKTSYKLSDVAWKEDLPLSLPASRLLRPVHAKSNFLNGLRLTRVLREMTVAAKAGECYHLWWHPHNFGANPKESMRDLAIIINHFKALEKKYDMKSKTMLKVYDYIKANKI